jgi:hypothetical protein
LCPFLRFHREAVDRPAARLERVRGFLNCRNSNPTLRDRRPEAASDGKIVIASEAKQSISPRNEKMDCFVAALLAMTAQTYVCLLAAPSARGLHRPCPSPRTEGAGKTGCALHPRSRVQDVHKNTHTSIQVQRRASGLPCAMALRLIARSPRRRIPLVTVACGLTILRIPVGFCKTSADLTSATDARTTRLHRTQHLHHTPRPAICRLPKFWRRP